MTFAIIFTVFAIAVAVVVAFAVRQASIVHDIYIEAMYVPQKESNNVP